MGIYKRGSNWGMSIKYCGKRYRKIVGPYKRQAEEVLRKHQFAAVEKRFFDVWNENKITLQEMGRDYLEQYSKLNKRSYSRDIVLMKHLVEYFGDRQISEITPLQIEEYKAKRLSEGLSSATVNRELALMKHLYTKASEWGKADKNPVKKVKLLQENNQRKRYLEKGEEEILLQLSPAFLKPIVFVALNTGMRQSELLTLTWDSVSFNNNVISVWKTKSGKARHIPMNSALVDVLKDLQGKCNPDSPYVFCNEKGRPWSRFGFFRGAFRRAVTKAGIRDFKFHDLRHTFASNLVMKGVSILDVKEFLGHSSLAMVMRYAHLSPEHKHAAVEKLCEQGVTNMAHRHFSVDKNRFTFLENILYNKQIQNNGRVAELADAQDLKS